jgi:hypothetical protein
VNGPSRTSQIVGRTVLAMVIGGLALTMCASPRAAETTPPIAWVLWDETRNVAWLSPKGHEARTTTATACAIATVEAAKYSPAGTRLACRRTRQ